ncbi:hypothetical protein C8R47DRAFT_1327290 [Mycena vitilis]|nr:hypothetical protein C8R47DRAFT_1327290 [Mycena vitilis]
MFLLASLSVLGVVALGPQVVLGSFKFSLSSVVQCAPVNITFFGGDSNNHSVPTTLTILPLLDNVPPIQIPIPNAAANSTGVQVTFIPLPAGTRFIASLDDIKGPAAKVSDVTKVLNATTGDEDSSCFGSSTPQVNFYEFNDELSQCEDFTVTYNTTRAPTIRAFNPRGGSFLVPQNNATTPNNTASYTMNGGRDAEIVLLFDDGDSHTQTTKLITISGDNTSPNACLKTSSASDHNNNGKSKTMSVGLSQSTIIGIAVGAVAVVLLAIALLIYVLRTRRRNRRAKDMDFDPALLNRRWPPEEKKIEFFQAPVVPTPPSPFSAGEGFVRDPIYTNDEKYAASIVSTDPRTSVASWNQFIPDAQPQGEAFGRRRQSISSSRLSMNTIDVEDILQMATVHQDRGSPTFQGDRAPQPSTAGTTKTAFDIAKPAMARLVSTRRNRRTSDPPELPGALSRNNSANAAAINAIPSGYHNSRPSYFDSDDEEDVPRLPRQPDSGIGGYPVPTFHQTTNRDSSESWGNSVYAAEVSRGRIP